MMRNRFVVILLLAALSLGIVSLGAGVASAQSVGAQSSGAQSPDAQIKHYIKICDQARSTLEMKYCLKDQYRHADGELNRVWKHVLSMIRNSGLPRGERRTWKGKLQTAQRHWVKFKMAECEGAVPYRYWRGTLAGVAVLHCLVRVTVTRSHALQSYLNEG